MNYWCGVADGLHAAYDSSADCATARLWLARLWGEVWLVCQMYVYTGRHSTMSEVTKPPHHDKLTNVDLMLRRSSGCACVAIQNMKPQIIRAVSSRPPMTSLCRVAVLLRCCARVQDCTSSSAVPRPIAGGLLEAAASR